MCVCVRAGRVRSDRPVAHPRSQPPLPQRILQVVSLCRSCKSMAADPGSNNNVTPKRGRNYPAIFCRSKKLSRHTAIYAPKLSRHFSPAKKLSRRTILRGRKLSRLSGPGAHVKTRCFSIILGPQATVWAAKHLRAAALQHTILQCLPQWALPSGPWFVCCGRWAWPRLVHLITSRSDQASR